MKTPKLSVVMANHNGQEFLKEAIESILNQTFDDFEFIIVDDFSKDNSLEIIKSYNDKRIVVIKNSSNLGLTKSLNTGLKIAKGEFIARMDSDDISEPDRFKKQLAFFEENSEYSVLGCYAQIINSKGSKVGELVNPIEDEEIKECLIIDNAMSPHGGLIIKKQALDDIGGYDESILKSQDYDLLLKLSEKYKMHNLPEFLYRWRTHGKSISNASRDSQAYYKNLAQENAIKRRYAKMPVTDPSLAVLYLCFDKVNIDYRQIETFSKEIHAYVVYQSKNQRDRLRKINNITLVKMDRNISESINKATKLIVEDWVLLTTNGYYISNEFSVANLKKIIAFDIYSDVFIPKVFHHKFNTFNDFYSIVISDNKVKFENRSFSRCNFLFTGSSIVNTNFLKKNFFSRRFIPIFNDLDMSLRLLLEGNELKARLVDTVQLDYAYEITDKTTQYVSSSIFTSRLEKNFKNIRQKYNLGFEAFVYNFVKNKSEEFFLNTKKFKTIK